MLFASLPPSPSATAEMFSTEARQARKKASACCW